MSVKDPLNVRCALLLLRMNRLFVHHCSGGALPLCEKRCGAPVEYG